KTGQAPVVPLVVEKPSLVPELPKTGEKQHVLLTVAGSLATMLGLAGLGLKRRKETK
ncbi:LPXTG cell wall anchor domain-containing protein, partial [Enterococcus faecalis]|uniref:LPXTG cell wall anchor domain-containing protein n=1 Tax=Enterococcus faecalis TaxID=1351 RepID=UPI003CC6989B